MPFRRLLSVIEQLILRSAKDEGDRARLRDSIYDPPLHELDRRPARVSTKDAKAMMAAMSGWRSGQVT